MTARCGRCETAWTLRPGDRECPLCGCQWLKGGKRVQEAAEDARLNALADERAGGPFVAALCSKGTKPRSGRREGRSVRAWVVAAGVLVSLLGALPAYPLVGSLANFSSHPNGSLGGVGSDESQNQAVKNKNSANPNKPVGQVGVTDEFLSGGVHGLRGRVHALLGDQVVNVALAGFGFLAFAGIGLGLLLDYFNRHRKWQRRLGWALFLSGLPLGFAGLLLGLP